MGRITRTVGSAAEYKEARSAAETLELTEEGVRASGAWEDKDGHPIFFGGDRINVLWVGNKYVHAMVDGQEAACLPVESPVSSTKDGELTVLFSE